MKILHVLYSGLGGHGNVFFSLYDADVNKEFTHQAIFFGIEEINKNYVLKAKERNIEWDFVKKKSGFDFSSYKKISGIIIKSECDVLFLHSSGYIIPALLVKVRKKIKIIVRETQANNLKNKKDWAFLSLACLLATKIVFLSVVYKNEILKKFKWLLNSNKIAVIPNGIDLNIFCPGKQNSDEFFLIGMQSRLVNIKDHRTLLKSFYLVKQSSLVDGRKIKLKIAGEGETKLQLEAFAKELSIDNDVEFTGGLNEQQLVTFLHSLNLYVHASFGETMSTAIMQAMACGLPIIASDVNGINNMIEHERTGVLVPVEDEQELSNTIIKLIKNQSYANDLGKNTHAFAKDNYSNLTMLKKYREVFYK